MIAETVSMQDNGFGNEESKVGGIKSQCNESTECGKVLANMTYLRQQVLVTCKIVDESFDNSWSNI